jgi:polyisoprenoid-binding protein YceI
MEPPSFPTISASNLKARMDRKETFFLIDTLPADHFRKVHLPGAVNACVHEAAFPDHIAGITTDPRADIVVHGAGAGSRDAAAAAEKLARMGYAKVAVFAGGLAEWRAAGHPLAGEAPAAADPMEPVFLFSDGRYRADPRASLLEWSGRNANGKHFGTVDLADGDVMVADGRATGRFAVDMATIRNADLAGDPHQPALISHLMSDDFFFVQRFPRATFEVRSVTPLEEATPTSPNHRVEGDLEIRGARRPLSFPATVNPLADGRIVAEAHFDIDRTRWGVIYGSSRFFAHLGMHRVYDLISLEIRLVFEG